MNCKYKEICPYSNIRPLPERCKRGSSEENSDKTIAVCAADISNEYWNPKTRLPVLCIAQDGSSFRTSKLFLQND